MRLPEDLRRRKAILDLALITHDWQRAVDWATDASKRTGWTRSALLDLIYDDVAMGLTVEQSITLHESTAGFRAAVAGTALTFAVRVYADHAVLALGSLVRSLALPDRRTRRQKVHDWLVFLVNEIGWRLMTAGRVLFRGHYDRW